MDVFFYGLFMDRAILLKNGIEPTHPRKGYLNHYALKIGNRASLIPLKGERAYGIVMSAPEAAIHQLYSESSVADYVPEKVVITSMGGETIPAFCYNLPAELIKGTNQSYAWSLYQLIKQEGFPEEYLSKVLRMAQSST